MCDDCKTVNRAVELASRNKLDHSIIQDFIVAFQCTDGVQPMRDSRFNRDRRIFQAICNNFRISGTAAKPVPRAPPAHGGGDGLPTKKQKVPEFREPDGFHGEIFLCNPRQHLQFVGPMRCKYYWVNHKVVLNN